MSCKYSYILPSYKVAGCISQCLDSIFSTPLTSYEVIIVNDGSPDELVGVLSEYFSAELKDGINKTEYKGIPVTVICQENAGVSAARNAGIDEAQGEYIIFVDPDDEVAPHSLEITDAAVSESEPDLLITGFCKRVLDKDGNVCGEVDCAPDTEYRTDTAEEAVNTVLPRFFGFSVDSILLWKNGVPLARQSEFGAVWRCVFKTEIIKKHNIRFSPEIILHEDGMFICDFITRCEKIRSVSGVTYIYNSAAEGAMSSVLYSFDRRFDLYNNKVKLLEFRTALAERLEQEGRGTGIKSFAGSNAMSCLELMTRFPLGEFKVIKPYINEPVVRASVKMMPKAADKKFNIAMAFLKAGLAYPLFAMVNIAKKLGVKF